MAHGLLDEEQEEVAARIEELGLQALLGVGCDILIAHVGRVANDGVELLAERIGEEIAYRGPFRCDAGVDFNAHDIGTTLAQGGEKGPVAGRWFQDPALVLAEVEHESHHVGGREYLAELCDVQRHQWLLSGFRAARSAAAFSRALFSQ
ncbi:hypothetical protein SDC9_199360 [bioreactor metagenome]|uniref:Uncharacterized protein n=1 Tax=bioreactor metagenome TaxID=1076179 RepID=A0A645IKA3_9ZZZZ